MAGVEHARDASRPGQEEPLVSIGEAALERMPALGLIFEQTAAAFNRSLARYADAPGALSFEDLEALRAGDLIDRIGPQAVILVFRAHGLDSDFAVAADWAFCELALDMILGASVSDSARWRSLTRIEDNLIAFVVERLLEEFSFAAATLTAISFTRNRTAEESGFAAIGPRASVAILARLEFQSLGGKGTLAIAAPRSAFDPFREALSRLPGAASEARDEKWAENLYAHVVRTEVRVDVKIEANGFTLGDIARMNVGDVLRLPIAPTSLMRLSSDGRTLFWCSLGQKDGRYTVRIEEFSDERQSFIENVLGV
ncbi:MAG: hypothetical protein CTY15_04185 [Methylocystis sp.]|nr:MAG: hypothetical protein CTY15_04185 [Methylocystis sp.]